MEPTQKISEHIDINMIDCSDMDFLDIINTYDHPAIVDYSWMDTLKGVIAGCVGWGNQPSKL